jgi:acetolactate synthase regulatory subunit
MGVQHYILKTDSKVIASQIKKECITRDETLERYLAVVRRMERFFKGFTVQYIERTKNSEADDGTPRCILSSHRRPLRENSQTRAKDD